MKRKISFILPAYKGKFLQKAIASILAQTYTDFELVVVDDASPDNLKEIVKTFHDSRLTYHRNEQNLGHVSVVSAWNHAMTYATGEFCVLASDDDIYHPDYLMEMMKLAEKYPSVDLFHCRVAMINASGDITYEGEIHKEYELCAEFLYYRGVKRYLQAAPDFFFRRKALEKIGGFIDFPCAIYSDDATWYMLALKNGVAASEKLLFYWRISGDNVSADPKNIALKIKACLEMNQWLKTFLPQIEIHSGADDMWKEVSSKIFTRSEDMCCFYLSHSSFFQWIRLIWNMKKELLFLHKRIVHERIKKILGFL